MSKQPELERRVGGTCDRCQAKNRLVAAIKDPAGKILMWICSRCRLRLTMHKIGMSKAEIDDWFIKTEQAVRADPRTISTHAVCLDCTWSGEFKELTCPLCSSTYVTGYQPEEETPEAVRDFFNKELESAFD